MESLSLSHTKNALRRLAPFVLILLVLSALIIAGWPWIKHKLLVLSYQWDSQKTAAVTFPNPLKDNPDFQALPLTQDKWKFDSRFSFETAPAVIYKAHTDTSYTISLNEQGKLRETLGFSDKARFFTQEALEVWSEDNKSFTINLEKHSLSYSVSLNLHPEYLKKTTYSRQEPLVDKAHGFFFNNLPEVKGFVDAEVNITYLSFDQRFGLGLSDGVNAIGFMATFYPKIGNQAVYGNSGYAQIAFGSDNAVLFFDVTPLYFSPLTYARSVYVMNANEIKNSVRNNQGYLDFACNNIKDVSAVRLKSPELILLYSKAHSLVEPVYRFNATIEQPSGDCAGKLYVPALKDKYYK